MTIGSDAGCTILHHGASGGTCWRRHDETSDGTPTMNVVTKLPLSRLITSRGDARLVGNLGREAIRDLLRRGAVRFVVADVGTALQWVSDADRFDFWKNEVQPHLAEPKACVSLEQFPGEYLYFASQWDDGSTPIILLSMSH